MTGEITLRGEVLPIGGLKEKLLAAHRGGITKVLIPEENEKDLAEIPKNIKDEAGNHSGALDRRSARSCARPPADTLARGERVKRPKLSSPRKVKDKKSSGVQCALKHCVNNAYYLRFLGDLG